MPIVIAFVVLVPCILYSFEIIPSNLALLGVPFILKKESLNMQSTSDAMIKKTSDSYTTSGGRSIHPNLQDKGTVSAIKEFKQVGGIYAISGS